MSNRKEFKKTTDVIETASVVFTKEQFLNSDSYRQHRDYISAALNDKKTYTKEQVDNMINKFYGKAGK